MDYWVSYTRGGLDYFIRTDAISKLVTIIDDGDIDSDVVCEWVINHVEARLPHDDQCALVHVNDTGTSIGVDFNKDTISIDRIYHKFVVPGWIPCVLYIDIEASMAFAADMKQAYGTDDLASNLESFVSDSVLSLEGISDVWKSVVIRQTESINEFLLIKRPCIPSERLPLS